VENTRLRLLEGCACRFVATEANATEGETSALRYSTEPELIALMDINGIGTGVAMADHISKINDREYVFARRGYRAAAVRLSGATARGGR